MTCIYCDGETDTSGACVAQCYWSQNKRFESSKSARWNTRPIEDDPPEPPAHEMFDADWRQ